METIFYFFLTRTLDDTTEIYPTDTFLGDIGDYIELDGVGYTISDYTIETYNYFDLLAGGTY